MATSGRSGVVRRWDVASGRQIAHFLAAAGGVLSVAFDPTGELIATGGADGTVRLWDAATGNQFGATFPASTTSGTRPPSHPMARRSSSCIRTVKRSFGPPLGRRGPRMRVKLRVARSRVASGGLSWAIVPSSQRVRPDAPDGDLARSCFLGHPARRLSEREHPSHSVRSDESRSSSRAGSRGCMPAPN
jgi:WD domain, G-beta repeat